MPLSAQQIQELNTASARLAAGRGNATDTANVNYARSRYGYTYNPVSGGPVSRSVQPRTIPITPRQQYESQGYTYLGTMEDVRNAVRQYGNDRVQNIAGNYYVLPALRNGPNTGSPIPADALSNPYGSLSNILGANVNPNSIDSRIAGLLALSGANTQEGQNVSDIQRQLLDLQGQLGGQSADLQAALNERGVPQAYQQIQELTLRAAQLSGELEQFDVQTQAEHAAIENQPIPTGLITGQRAQLQKQRDLERIGKAAELATSQAMIQAYQGNATLGTQLAQQAVEMKYAPILNNINVLQTQLGFANDQMSRADQRRANIISELISQRKTEIETQRQTESDISSLAVTAATNGAPTSVIQSMLRSGNAATAAQVGSRYLRARTGGSEITASSGFANSSIESDIRGDATKLKNDIKAKTTTVQDAYDQLRTLYSPQEVTDEALMKLIGYTPPAVDLPGGGGEFVAKRNREIQQILNSPRNSYRKNIIDSIGNFLFRK